MNTVELFCGTKSFSKVAQERGHRTLTVDMERKFRPDIVKNILYLTPNDIASPVDILWASPPCNCFSVASIGRHWGENRTPKSDSSKMALIVLEHTVELIKELKPKYWFIENPRGMMRKMNCMQGLERITVTYCQYGDTRMKPTDIWTNTDIELKPPCKNGAPCHERAPRGAKTGTQGIKGAINRGIVPSPLIEDVIKYCEEKIR